MRSRVSFGADKTEERMEVYCGLSLTPSHPPVVGRLVLGGRKGAASFHGACLSVCSPDDGREDSEGEGIVVVGNSSFDVSAAKQSPRPILAIPALAERCMGKIAVLDPALGKLFVSPDLETVAYYSSRLGRMIGESSKPTEICADAKLLSVSRAPKEQIVFCESGRILDLRHRAYREESVYELCGDFADLSVGQTVTVAVEVWEKEEGEEAFCAMMKEIFRAAVLGDFSLLIGGCHGERDLQRCRSALNRCFCELASEGREFNGYIPKGLLIDRLLYPLSGGSFDGLDFCCIDVKTLSQSLTGLSWDALLRRECEWTMIGESLRSVVDIRGEIPLWGWFCEALPPRALCRAFLRAGMVGWIFEQECGVETRRYLREIWENDRMN